MRSVLPCFGYTPRHARPGAHLPAARTAVAVGVAAALLPLGAAPALAAPARATTALTFAAPAYDADAKVPVSVRLLANGRPVKNGFVRLERRTGRGWSYVGRLLTKADGRGAGTLRLPGDSTLRARYAGAATRTSDVTPARRVDVGARVATRASRSAARTSAPVAGNAVTREAAKHVGKPYRWGATGPSSFDCSGYTGYVYRQLGKTLPRTSHAQEAATTRVSRAAARPGDLVFIKDVRGHVGIYAGNGKMYDAPRAGKTISLRKIWTPNYVIGRVS